MGEAELDFSLILREKAEECETFLFEYFDKLHDDRTTLYDAMRYSVASGGKRLRMILLLECAQLFSSSIDDCIPFACAVEMIHSYSLIHDDLPALDNAEYRRGKLCNHKVFGESMAMLAGDGLLHYSFEVMLSASLSQKTGKSHLYIKAMKEIANYSGISGMVLGQSIDTQANQFIDYDLLKFIYLKKTASMFIGPMKAGAIISGADDAQIALISDFAYNFGMAFQVTDDILDETGDFAEFGKTIGTDKKNNKNTVSSLLGVDQAYRAAVEYITEAQRIISYFNSSGFFINLCNYIINRKL